MKVCLAKYDDANSPAPQSHKTTKLT